MKAGSSEPCLVVAIDGPAGAGKSTVAAAAAAALGFRYLNTGGLYRAIALAVLEAGADPDDEDVVTLVARTARVEATDGRVLLRGRDVTERVNGPDVTAAVSAVAAYGSVRALMLERQRRAARGGDIVIEGRDIGAVVVPDASLKVWLTASLPERASRRAAQLGAAGGGHEAEQLAHSIAERDLADSTRSESPLVRADDAVVLDTTGIPVDEVVAQIVELVRGSR